jgi:hypothetical protein
MKATEIKYYYLFRGAWFQRLEEVIPVITDEQPFEIWEPKDKTKELHLLIIYEKPLSGIYCLGKNIWGTTKDIAASFFTGKSDHFTIHKYEGPNPMLCKAG